MTRFLSIIGTRPQYMKVLDLKDHVLVDTGQHYDKEMTQFVQELKLKPKYTLKTETIGEMIDGCVDVINKETPSVVIVYGDTRSTLAGALSARLCNKTLVHVEAGMRSHDDTQPEEFIRKTVDRMSDYLFCANEFAKINLIKDGILHNVHVVGDPLWDSLKRVLPIPATKDKGTYVLLTVHRAVNTDSKESMEAILEAMKEYGKRVIFPIHPRTKRALKKWKLKIPKNIEIIKPQGYKEMISLECNAQKIVTDSGGVQREAYWFAIPIIILRWETEWSDIVDDGWGVLVGNSKDQILEALKNHDPKGHLNKRHLPQYGARDIIKTILEG